MLKLFRSTCFRVALLAACAAPISLAACSGLNAQLPAGATAAAIHATVPSAVNLRASKYQTAVLKTNPIAYFPLNSATQGSVVGGYTTSLLYGAKIAKPGAIKADKKQNKYLSLSNQAYATTSLSGGIPGTGSMVAWVNLSELPSDAGAYFYISGESQVGNDFDLQFENDNNLYFYTGSGENTEYVTDLDTLVGKWNMIAVSYAGGSNGFRNIYWNGKLAVPYTGPVNGGYKTTQFSIGESLVFTGRYYQGGIDAVAVWGRALKASEIKAIYSAAK
ncbi:MAG TPA: LamG domain-containing protein [Candidatus Nitrosotalea sp.]|nr:LamG domain-containing protein [Candidatus Nitrosotalea sp.]